MLSLSPLPPLPQVAPTETSQPPKESEPFQSSEGSSSAAAKPPSDDPFMAFEQSSTPQKVPIYVCIYAICTTQYVHLCGTYTCSYMYDCVYTSIVYM